MPMPTRNANAATGFSENPDFEEAPTPPPVELADRLKLAREEVAAMKDAPVPNDPARPDETLPGGVYIVNGQIVDAWGQPIDEKK